MNVELQDVSAAEEEGLLRYSAFSRAATGSFLLGLASFLSLWHPGWWFLPPLSALLGLVALRNINAPGSHLSGRKTALIGLMLALFFGSLAPSAYLTRRLLINRAAQEHAQHWLELVRQGQLEDAYQLHLIYYQRSTSDTDAFDRYAMEMERSAGSAGRGAVEMMTEFTGTKAQMNAFFGTSPINRLIEIGTRGELRYVGNLGHDYTPRDGTFVREQFVLEWDQAGFKSQLPMVVMLRLLEVGDERWWNVEQVYSPQTGPM